MKEQTGTEGTRGQPALPHTRDETSAPSKQDGQRGENRKATEQGRRDVESGVQDTERIGVPTAVPPSNDRR